MPTPEDQSFFEGLNNDLAKSIGKSIESGFKGNSIGLDPETVKLIGAEFERSVKPLANQNKQDDGGGGGGEGSAGQSKALTKIVRLAKGTFSAARQMVSQNASNILTFGDQMARTAAATNHAFLMNGNNISRKFGLFGQNLADVGNAFDTALRENVRGMGKNTQSFLARTTGLGTALGTTTKFLASNTNVLGRSITETTALGTDLQNIALSNGMVADSIFDAVAAFQENTRKQQVLFGDKAAGDFQGIVAGLEGLIPGGNLGELVAKAAPTSVDDLLNLDILGGMFGGAFNSQGIQEDPARHTANFIASMATAADEISTMTVRQGAQFIEQRFGKFGITLGDIQKASVATEQAGGVQGLMTAMKGGSTAIKSDEELERQISENSISAANNMKNFAIEVEGLNTVQKGLAIISDTLRTSFFDLNGETTKLAETMGLAAAGEAGLQAASKMGVGGAGSLLTGGLGGAGLFAAQKLLKPVSLGGSAAVANASAASQLRDPKTGKFVKGSGVANPLTQQGRAVMRARNAAGLTQGVAKGMSKRIPLLGGALAGGFELAETGDVSRAVSKGAGALGGTAAGAAGGAAIGTLIFPGVGTVIGGLLGGIFGGLGGEKAAEVVHDQFDTEFVKEQEERNKAELQAEKEATMERQARADEEEVQTRAEQLAIAENSLGAIEGVMARLDITNDLLAQGAFEDRLTRTPGGASIAGSAGATQRG